MNQKPMRFNKWHWLIVICAVCFSLGVLFISFPWILGIDVAVNPASAPAPRLGVVIDKDMRVVYVESGSAAEKSGIQLGDTLKQFNKRQVANPRQARNVFGRQDVSKPVTVILMRDDSEVTLIVELSRTLGVPGGKTPTPVPADEIYLLEVVLKVGRMSAWHSANPTRAI